MIDPLRELCVRVSEMVTPTARRRSAPSPQRLPVATAELRRPAGELRIWAEFSSSLYFCPDCFFPPSLFAALPPLSPSLESWRAEPGTFGSFSSLLLLRITLDWCRNPGTSRCCTTVLKSTTSWTTGTRCSLECSDPTSEFPFPMWYASLHPCPDLPLRPQAQLEGCRVRFCLPVWIILEGPVLSPLDELRWPRASACSFQAWIPPDQRRFPVHAPEENNSSLSSFFCFVFFLYYRQVITKNKIFTLFI